MAAERGNNKAFARNDGGCFGTGVSEGGAMCIDCCGFRNTEKGSVVDSEKEWPDFSGFGVLAHFG